MSGRNRGGRAVRRGTPNLPPDTSCRSQGDFPNHREPYSTGGRAMRPRALAGLAAATANGLHRAGPHAGALGAAVLRAFHDRGWVAEGRRPRELTVTAAGERLLAG